VREWRAIGNEATAPQTLLHFGYGLAHFFLVKNSYFIEQPFIRLALSEPLCKIRSESLLQDSLGTFWKQAQPIGPSAFLRPDIFFSYGPFLSLFIAILLRFLVGVNLPIFSSFFTQVVDFRLLVLS